MREPQYSLLADIQYDIELARQGKFALYGQRNIAREYRCKKATPEEQQAYETLQNVLFMVPQWSDTEELHSDMERIGGRVWFCYFWEDHDSMIQLTEDSCGTFTTAYVLDADITPEMRKSAARQAQQQLAAKASGAAFEAEPNTGTTCRKGKSVTQLCRHGGTRTKRTGACYDRQAPEWFECFSGHSSV